MARIVDLHLHRVLDLILEIEVQGNHFKVLAYSDVHDHISNFLAMYSAALR